MATGLVILLGGAAELGENMAYLLHGRTVFVIAHLLSITANTFPIVVFDMGILENMDSIGRYDRKTGLMRASSGWVLSNQR
jgi:ABC-type bacteriocin/lantibiotic exporter with double-glycine peptidase domain